MTKSGRYAPTPAIPIPDFAVPYAAPVPVHLLALPHEASSLQSHTSKDHLSRAEMVSTFVEPGVVSCSTYRRCNSCLFRHVSHGVDARDGEDPTIPKKGAKLGESSLPGPCVVVAMMRLVVDDQTRRVKSR
jgi:hypothetical protein